MWSVVSAGPADEYRLACVSFYQRARVQTCAHLYYILYIPIERSRRRHIGVYMLRSLQPINMQITLQHKHRTEGEPILVQQQQRAIQQELLLRCCFGETPPTPVAHIVNDEKRVTSYN